jgi:Predicted nucleotide-binding protein containing TIR-like domain
MRKPRIFIGSALESLDVADAINVNLDHQAEVTVWKNGFKLSSDTIDSLVEKARTVDFAIFVFTPDDIVTIRNQKMSSVRDNVVFELGLFAATLGKQRCFIVKPRDVELHLPSDLLGLTPADYDGNRSDGDLTSAVNHPCVLIKREVSNLGLLASDMDVQVRRRKRTGYSYTVGAIEYKLLNVILAEYSGSPDGVSVWNIFQQLKRIEKGSVGLAAIKLERMGYIEKAIATDPDGNNHYTFAITADGIDYLLENEKVPTKDGINDSTAAKEDFDDDIPF